MSRRLLPLVVLVTVMAGAFLSRADEPDLKTVSADDLIVRLGSAEFAEREQASKALQARGPAILPALRKAVEHKDAEVRRSAEELISTLETVAALTPKRVTLSVEKQPIAVILKEVMKQTGYRIEVAEFNDQDLFDIEMKDVSFWEALERIGRLTGYVIVPSNSEEIIPADENKDLNENICLKRRKAGAPFVENDGIFRVELIRVHEDRDLNLRESGRDCHLAIGVNVRAEPNALLDEVQLLNVEVARDENGKTLNVTQPKSKYWKKEMWGNSPYLHMKHDAEIQLRRTEENGKIIKELRGTIPVQVTVCRRLLTASNKFLESNGTIIRFGNGTVEIVKAEYDDKDDSTRLVIAMSRKNGYPLAVSKSIYIEDAKGNRYVSPSLFIRTDAGNDYFEIRFEYAKSNNPELGPPARIMVADCMRLHLSIPFVFKDVPLP